jgi:hypothetical protein
MGARTVLWVGGMPGVGKTTAARTVARRYDLWLYAVDARTYAHAEAMGVRALEMTPDELWLDRTPEHMAHDFEAEARERFALILDDLRSLPADGAPALVEGPQLLPELLEGPVLCVAAAAELQSALMAARPSFTYSATSDPERALANRIRRDELLGARLRARTAVAAVADVRETEPLVDAFVREHAADWVARPDRGDVGARRRDDNERRLDQWRRYAEHEPRAADGTVDFACECDRPGCAEVVSRTLAEAARSVMLAH